MKFSVVIPLYNKEKDIKRAIDSVLRQTYKDFELIIVDDGSTDSSFKNALNSSNDSRIKIFQKTNGGVSSARNFGIQNALYDYIGLLDADDEWKPTFLESIYQLIKKYPEAGAFSTSYEFKNRKYIKRANIKTNIKDGEEGIVNYFRDTLYDHLITASSVVIKKEVFDKVGLFSTNLNRGEDLEMWCRIALRYQIAFKNEVLATYYQDSDNKLTKLPIEYSKSFMNNIEKMLDEQIEKKTHSIYYEEYLVSRIIVKARHLINDNNNNKARKLLWKYRYTKYNRRQWINSFILSFKPLFYLYRKITKKRII